MGKGRGYAGRIYIKLEEGLGNDFEVTFVLQVLCFLSIFACYLGSCREEGFGELVHSLTPPSVLLLPLDTQSPQVTFRSLGMGKVEMKTIRCL